MTCLILHKVQWNFLLIKSKDLMIERNIVPYK